MQRVLVASDFNVGNLAAILAHDPGPPGVEVVDTPFGQPFQVLADSSLPCWSGQIDCLVVWTLPHRVISGFARALAHETVDHADILEEVDRFGDLIRGCAPRARTILVPSWELPPWERGWGLLDRRPGTGIRDLLSRMNQRLAARLEPAASSEAGSTPSPIYMLDAARWLGMSGAKAHATKAWYMGKIPFGTEVFKLAAADIKSALQTIDGAGRKLLVLDLDDTLWGGIVGDIGWEHLVLGGHHADGEALVDFQRAIKALSRRGILLGLVSKNDESVATTAIREHPEMVLRLEDFAGWRINWQDKAANVADLAAELNLGLQSVVFIDDNPAERARVREALPEVLVPEWPADRSHFRKALLQLTCFDTAVVTSEDHQRTAMYASERERRQARANVGSLDDWLGTLEMEVEVERLTEANLARAAQLLNKTNQMNLRTRRMTAGELIAWSRVPGHAAWTVKVRDRFGDLGLTGFVSVARLPDGPIEVTDFLLSCRAMGRKIEEAMLAIVDRHAREHGAAWFELAFAPTAKNRPCLDFLNRSGLTVVSTDNVFRWDSAAEYPMPPQLTVRVARPPRSPLRPRASGTSAALSA